MRLLKWLRQKHRTRRIRRSLNMNDSTVRALAELMGPMMEDGFEMSFAERVAKIRAFEAGDYAGEPCDSCGERQALLDPVKMWDGFTHNLCHGCSGKAAVVRDREKRTA